MEKLFYMSQLYIQSETYVYTEYLPGKSTKPTTCIKSWNTLNFSNKYVENSRQCVPIMQSCWTSMTLTVACPEMTQLTTPPVFLPLYYNVNWPRRVTKN